MVFADNSLFDVIIFGGQSNMQGQSEKLIDDGAIAGAYEYKMLRNEFVPLKDPAGEDIRPDGTAGVPYTDELGDAWHPQTALGSAAYGNSTLLPPFAKEYTSLSGRNMIAVHAAKGSTDMACWLPGTTGYAAIVNKTVKAVKAAKKRGFSVGNVYMVWLQGESDAIIGKAKQVYKKELAKFADALKKDVDLEKFGIIRVGRFTNDEKDMEIIDAQDEICEENKDFIMLTRIATELNNDPESMNPFVGGHFSAYGLQKLGWAAGKTLAEYVKNQSSAAN